MRKLLPILALFQFTVIIALSSPSLAQEWQVRAKPRGTLKVVDLYIPLGSLWTSYQEGLLELDKDNNLVACLAEDWRWIDDRTVEFKLREGVRFHNGEKFSAETVRVNWEAYKAMETPLWHRYCQIPDETKFEIIDEYTVRFSLPEPDGMASMKFFLFKQVAPSFFKEHKFTDTWGVYPEPGPWGTGPFKLVQGTASFGDERAVLKANENYWDRRYPKVERVIFEHKFFGDREEAMRLCREMEGEVDIVSFIRPLDTLKVAESQFAKVVKSRDVAILRGYFNLRKKDSKWRDIRLRKAINYAINREELWKYGAKGNAYNLGGFIPPGAFGHNPNLTLFNYDTDNARSLLSEAGYPDGFDIKLITHEAFKLEAQIISKMLERIGLKVHFEILTFNELVVRTFIPFLDKPPKEQDWDIALSIEIDRFAHTGATLMSFGLLDASYQRWIEYDEEYEKMWEDMKKTTDVEKQEQKIQDMVRYVYDQAYLVFIYSPLTLYAVNKEIDFVPHKLCFLRLAETSVTDNHWSLRERDK